jgi:hypothetical protein
MEDVGIHILFLYGIDCSCEALGNTYCRFDYTAGEYISVKFVEGMIDHLELESTSLHKDSQEAQDQLQMDGNLKEGESFFKKKSTNLSRP